MFSCTRTVRLKDTDATGVIYFASLFSYALEAFEEALSAKGMPLSQILSQGHLMPIVHAEADFLAPMRVGDEVLLELSLSKLGGKSFAMEASLFLLPEKRLSGKAKIVHAFVKKGEERASELPAQILSFFQEEFLKPSFQL